MFERLIKVRQQDENFDRKLVDNFAKIMPKLLSVMIDQYLYDSHIGSHDVAMLVEPFIKNNKGEKIGFHFDYDTAVNHAKKKVDLNETDFYPNDIFTFSNIIFGDMGHLTRDEDLILDYALESLMDSDFPFYPASQRAFRWLKKHIELEERQKEE